MKKQYHIVNGKLVYYCKYKNCKADAFDQGGTIRLCQLHFDKTYAEDSLPEQPIPELIERFVKYVGDWIIRVFRLKK